MTLYSVMLSDLAIADIKQIAEYIAIDRKSVAKKHTQNIRKEIHALAQFPLKGRIVPELECIQNKTYREIMYLVWRIVYKIENKQIKIMGIFDSRRKLNEILFKRSIGLF